MALCPSDVHMGLKTNNILPHSPTNVCPLYSYFLRKLYRPLLIFLFFIFYEMLIILRATRQKRVSNYTLLLCIRFMWLLDAQIKDINGRRPFLNALIIKKSKTKYLISYLKKHLRRQKVDCCKKALLFWQYFPSGINRS